MTMNSMRELFLHELSDLYSAEKQLVKALPKMTNAASCETLSAAFLEHTTITEAQVIRLETCFKTLGETAEDMKCKAMEGLVKEAAGMIEEEGNPLVRDAGLVGAAQRVEHYEIAAYGTCVELAKVLGETEVAELLQLTLDEEYAANLKLTEIATTEVNPKAMLSAAVTS